ncbi:Ground-like domain-containing protein [Caenorhabditis elegans]|uniref:Ground-like domain-containing protein n=1 Tax=Caenorhabditis elegans TaxID=6239 RepID=Q20327_CAEEL|nr:Ground-like domain-containing protein [Caenorhabditis elegans]CCD63348.1 Ground-like domain-containing protein [Caenorhabditis elegans]|eukprot:NP_501166.2 GRound-Like (grd related) [Caenorhabditis elegans]
MLLPISILFSIIPIASSTFGGCCSMGPPPCPPPPPPMCAPPPLPCPPPPICPPQFCPPPPMCPPPPPPPPPPMCPPPPPPMPSYSPCQSYAPAPVFNQYAMQPANDCCCRCGSPCRFMARHRTHGSKLFTTEDPEEDPTCNSKKLRRVMERNMNGDPSISKRAIQKAVEEKMFGKFNVICARGDFSYVAYTETYCQVANDDVTCYAFRPM